MHFNLVKAVCRLSMKIVFAQFHIVGRGETVKWADTIDEVFGISRVAFDYSLPR